MAVSLPAEVVYGKVTGSARLAVADGLDPDTLPDGQPATGTVTFTPAVDRLVLGASDTILIIAPQTAMFDENGDFEIDLVATNIPDANPLNWTYNVQVVVDGMQRPWTFPCEIEGGTTVDISDIAPVKSSSGVFFTKGDPGKSAYQVAVDEGFVGTEAEWLLTLNGTVGGEETVLLGATTELPIDKAVLTVRATSAALVTLPNDAPGGTVITVHVAEGWEHITFDAGIVLTGETQTTETWVVLVRAEDTWQALVSGDSSSTDTGWVTVTSMLNTTIFDTGLSSVRVRRVGDFVTLDFQGTIKEGGAPPQNSFGWFTATTGGLPLGFRPLTFIRQHTTGFHTINGAYLTVKNSGTSTWDLEGFTENQALEEFSEYKVACTFVTTDPLP